MKTLVKIAAATVLLLGTQSAAVAQKIVGDVDFQYLFDNREFDRGGNTYTNSMTINSASLTPYLGLKFGENSGNTVHHLMLGLNLRREMGEVPTSREALYSPAEAAVNQATTAIIREVVAYYHLGLDLGGDRQFSAVAGVYPRSMSEGDYSEAMLSDSLRHYDPFLDGMLFKYRSGKMFAELGLDWQGLSGVDRREAFEVYSAGSYSLAPVLSLGWALSARHLACSASAHGVVDNVLLNPYAKLDLSEETDFQRLSLKAGAIVGYHRDRLYKGSQKDFPVGAEVIADVRKWNFGVLNTFYAGKSQMPYYTDKYESAIGSESSWISYGPLLYRGAPFYRHNGAYNKLEAYYEPHISDYARFRISLDFHFASGYGFLGSQQKFSLIFNLGRQFQNK